MQETKNCTLNYGASVGNNCFGIRNGNTVPCKKMIGSFCAYDTPEESYEAFKIIWQKWYVGMPDLEKAKRWSGDDRASIWLKMYIIFITIKQWQI